MTKDEQRGTSRRVFEGATKKNATRHRGREEESGGSRKIARVGGGVGWRCGKERPATRAQVSVNREAAIRSSRSNSMFRSLPQGAVYDTAAVSEVCCLPMATPGRDICPATAGASHSNRRCSRQGMTFGDIAGWASHSLPALGRTSLLVGLDHGGIWPGELNLLPSPIHSRRRIHESARSHAAMDMPGPSMSVYGHYEESCQGPKRDAQAEFMRGSIAVLCQPTRGRVTSSVRGDLCLIATVKCRDPVGQREICCPRQSVVQPAVEGCHVARRARQYHCSCIVSPCCTGVAQLAVQHMRCKCQPRVNKAGVRQDKSRQAHSRRRDKLLLEHRVYWFYLLP